MSPFRPVPSSVYQPENRITRSEYDVVVIGAGPGGSVAAREFALRGYSVLLIEKRPVIGSPVRCGEATGPRTILGEYAPVFEDAIETDLRGAILHGPAGISVKADMPRVGVMLDRIKFDPYMAKMASEAGAEVVVDARATDVRLPVNGRRVVPIVWNGETLEVSARLVVGADGVEALTGRWTGLKSRQLPPYTCTAIELKVKGIIDPNDQYLTFWHGHDHINDGYIWSFPKVKSQMTNFGLGFITPKLGTPNPKEQAETWLERFYPGAQIADCWGGTVPVSGNLEQSVADHFLLLGDSAHHTNPMTGGGIASAMRAAQIAGRVVHECFRKGDLSEGALKAYDRACWERFGKNHAREMGVRKFVLGMNREEQVGFYGLLKDFVESGSKITPILRHPLQTLKYYRMYKAFSR